MRHRLQSCSRRPVCCWSRCAGDAQGTGKPAVRAVELRARFSALCAVRAGPGQHGRRPMVGLLLRVQQAVLVVLGRAGDGGQIRDVGRQFAESRSIVQESRASDEGDPIPMPPYQIRNALTDVPPDAGFAFGNRYEFGYQRPGPRLDDRHSGRPGAEPDRVLWLRPIDTSDGRRPAAVHR